MTAASGTTAHDTIRLERHFAHAPPSIFSAYANVEARIEWTAPSDEEIVVYESDDFQVGGIDQFLCGPRSAPDFVGTTRYEDIVRDERIVFTERLVHGDQFLAMSLVTWELTPTATGTTLVVTDQVTSLAGQGPIDGSRSGYAAILDRLADHLDDATQ